MPDAIITSTASTFGTITGTFAADQSTITGTVSGIITGTLSGSVGVPGPQGPTGPQGPIGPEGPPGEGGTWGSIVGDIEDQVDLWTELGTKYPASNPSGFITSSALSPYLTTATANATFQTLAGMSSYLTTSAAAAGYYPLSGNPSGFLTSASLSGYATESWVTGQGYITSSALTPYLLSSTAASTYAVIAAGQPTSGTVGQVLTKQSGASYDSAWQTLIPGDRYLTSSTTSLTINNANKTLTVGTGLSYTTQQDVIIAYDATHHMHCLVTAYNSSTGQLDVDVISHTGTGTFASWTVNVGGTVPLQSVEWGEILGTLGDQTDLATALNAKLEITDAASTYAAKAGVTFTGKVNTLASAAGGAGLNLPHGTAPTTPVNGDIWTTTTTVQWRRNGATANLAHSNLANTFTAGQKQTVSHSTTTAGLNVGPVAGDPSTPANGDVWHNLTTLKLRARVNAVSESIALESWVTSRGYLTASALTGYATESWVTSQGYLTASALTGYATESFVTSQGYLTDAPSDGNQYARKDGLWDIVSAGYITSVSAPFTVTGGDLSIDLTPYAPVDSPDLTGVPTAPTAAVDTNTTQLATTAWVNGQAGTAAPLVDGTAASGSSLRYARQDHVHPSDTTRAALSGATFTGLVGTPASTTITAGLRIPHGSAPSTPTNGDVWTTTSGLFARINAGTQQYMSLGNTQTVSGAITFSNANQNLGTSTAAGTINVGTGATIAGSTKTVNVGTGGVASSFTFVNIGSSTGSSTTTVQGSLTTTGTSVNIGSTTATQSINIGAIATSSGNTKTIDIGGGGVSGATTSISIGSSVAGVTSTTTLHGITNGVTEAVDTNNTELATTAFVIGQAAAATPLVDGTAAVGTSLRYARADHVHPTDTSRAALNSPAFTGTPSLPTGTTAVTQTAGNNTTAVATTAFVTAAVPALATASDSRQFTNETKAMSPRDVLWSMLSQDFVDISGPSMNVTSVGTITHVQVGQLSRTIRPGTAGACSSRIRTFGTSQVDQTWTSSSRAQPSLFLNFSLRSIHSGRSSTAGVSDANYTCAFYYGKAEADGVGNLIRRGYGWKMVGGAGSRFLELQAHNGTTLSSVTSSFAVTAGVAFDWDIESDGAGNVTLYVNGSSVATSTGGPTGSISLTAVTWQEEVVAAAALSGPYLDFVNSRGRYIVINPW